jgi:hypothetical protein
MHRCKLGCEGVVSKRLGSTYRSRRSPRWGKVKNPKPPAVDREAAEGLGAILTAGHTKREGRPPCRLKSQSPIGAALRSRNGVMFRGLSIWSADDGDYRSVALVAARIASLALPSPKTCAVTPSSNQRRATRYATNARRSGFGRVAERVICPNSGTAAPIVDGTLVCSSKR